MKMDDKTVLITGSTDGVGRYVAARLAAAGAKVLIHGRDKARAKTLADEIRGAGHGEPIFYQADLSSLGGVHATLQRSMGGSHRLRRLAPEAIGPTRSRRAQPRRPRLLV